MDDRVPEIDVEEAKRRLDAGAQMIDVREEGEYRESHIPGAKLIPMSEFNDRLSEFPEGEELLIQCRSGGRSAQVTQALVYRDYRAVKVAGGILAWE